MRRLRMMLCPLALLCALSALQADTPAAGKEDKPAKPDKTKPKSNLDLWLTGKTPAPPAKPGTSNPLDSGNNPFRKGDTFLRTDALPGVVELNDGRQIPGGLYTTREKDFEVHIAAEKRWRRVPFVLVRAIEAVLLEEKMDQHWRWKAMGVPERVYTGKEYPYRRFEWKFHLIDGTSLQGTVKGQPLWIEKLEGLAGRGRYGPFVLHERFSGAEGTKLKDHPYMKQIVISRRMMKTVAEHQGENPKDVVRGNPATEGPTKYDVLWGKDKPGPNKPGPGRSPAPGKGAHAP